MHLLFNLMSLYNLNEVEAIYGTLAYLYFSLTLVVLTILAAMASPHPPPSSPRPSSLFFLRVILTVMLKPGSPFSDMPVRHRPSV